MTEAQDQAFELAHKRLARRDHTVAQIRERLLAGGFDQSLADEVVATLREQRYLDDERFAARIVEDRRNLDRWGEQRIEEALLKAGVAREIAARALRVDAEHDEFEAALALLRARQPRPPHDERSRARALGLLLRRGYDSDLAYDAVREFERAAVA